MEEIRSLDSGELEIITGTLERIIFRSEETGYTVCSVRLLDSDKSVTVVGIALEVYEGETLKATGRWEKHKLHGLQFHAESMISIPPLSVKGIEKFLSSGLIRGVGKVTARRIVERFKEDTLKVLDNESARLEEIAGISTKRRLKIKKSWDEYKAIREIMIFLREHGVGVAQSSKIYRTYGKDSIAVIRSNPYRLCNDIWGIGFKTADQIAMALGFAPDSEVRARAGILYTLTQISEEEGHCYVTIGQLLQYGTRILEIPEDRLIDACEKEMDAGNIIQKEDKIYLRSLYESEKSVAIKLVRIMKSPYRFPIEYNGAIDYAAGKMKIKFSHQQYIALENALKNRISIITGGPGVGKTTIIKAIVEIFTRAGIKVALTAPTGRAAKRLEEATGFTAKTIHRMLKIIPGVEGFLYTYTKPLEEKVFVVDEMSMVDIDLMAKLVSALPDDCWLIFVGDADQLPSVGPGNVLHDLICSQKIVTTKLTEIFRQSADSAIVLNAHRVNRGEMIVDILDDRLSDFYFIKVHKPERILNATLEIVTRRIPERFGFDPRTEIQVLTPMKKNLLGAENLNIILQERFNPSGPEVNRFGRIYRKGDRVMQIRNNYDKDVYNGDIGIIESINHDELKLTVNYDDNRIVYDFTELDELVHAYACSIHKAQGSEYPAVVVVISTSHYKLLQRNLLYTAITRGKKLVCVVGSPKAVAIAIKNDKVKDRQTGLKEMIIEEFNKDK